MKRLTWISVPGDEYQATIGTMKVNLKPVEDGWLLLDSKPGVFFRRERCTILGTLEDAMRGVENKYIV